MQARVRPNLGRFLPDGGFLLVLLLLLQLAGRLEGQLGVGLLKAPDGDPLESATWAVHFGHLRLDAVGRGKPFFLIQALQNTPKYVDFFRKMH